MFFHFNHLQSASLQLLLCPYVTCPHIFNFQNDFRPTNQEARVQITCWNSSLCAQPSGVHGVDGHHVPSLVVEVAGWGGEHVWGPRRQSSALGDQLKPRNVERLHALVSEAVSKFPPSPFSESLISFLLIMCYESSLALLFACISAQSNVRMCAWRAVPVMTAATVCVTITSYMDKSKVWLVPLWWGLGWHWPVSPRSSSLEQMPKVC